MWVKRVVTLKIRFIFSYVTAILNSVTVGTAGLTAFGSIRKSLKR
jgi:hypothetical protein